MFFPGALERPKPFIPSDCIWLKGAVQNVAQILCPAAVARRKPPILWEVEKWDRARMAIERDFVRLLEKANLATEMLDKLLRDPEFQAMNASPNDQTACALHAHAWNSALRSVSEFQIKFPATAASLISSEIRAAQMKWGKIEDERAHAFERARIVVRQALGDGVLSALVITRDGERYDLPAKIWLADSGVEIMQYARIGEFRPANSIAADAYVLLQQDTFRRWIEPAKKQTNGGTIADETRLLNWLAGEMAKAPDAPRSKAAMAEQAKNENGKEVSSRGFERVWRNAVAQSGAHKWARGGRRKPVSETPQ